MGRKKKCDYTTKLDNIPADAAVREDMIEQFIAENQDDTGSFQIIEAVPHETQQMVKSTAGVKRQRGN